MEPDLSDTRLSVPQTPGVAVAPGEDFDDTVARAAVAAPVRELGDLDDTIGKPPALVEPPAPASRELPLFVEPVFAVDTDEVDLAPVAEFVAVFTDGTEVPLDTTVYFGRKPSVPRIHVGPNPRLVTLASPTREMSATHLELTVLGGSLVASDMRSTNGTIVQTPGSAPRTLIRGESAVIVAGTRIDLGEGAVFDILPVRARESE